MKFNYCPSCGQASNRTRFEKDRCVSCGKKGTQIVEVKRSIFYYLAYVTFILGAAVVFFLPHESYGFIRWIIFFGFLVAGAFLSVASMNQMSLDAMKIGGSREDSDDESD